MNTVIFYYSHHHGNTKKLVDAAASVGDVTLIDITEKKDVKLDEYDLIGFASGIYFGKYNKELIDFARENLPCGKRVFFIHTGGSPREKHNYDIRSIAE